MLAKWKAHKNFGYVFVFALLSFIMFLYITNVYLAWIVKMPLNFGKVIYLIIAHLMVFLFLWSFVQTLISDPGPVPLYWGFFLDDPEHKKRRYCLACHIFKPERCHHCSVCNRCVLNMDHHCPWVNNCIGFYNRKYFILMLFYVVLTSFVILCGQIHVEIVIIEEFSDFIDNDGEFDWALNIFIIFGFIADVSIFFVILFFFKFHCTLIFNNLTTIEHLESKRSFSQTNYDIGFLYNFYQIFGKNWILWPFPIFLESGKPVGDGVVWLQRYKDTVVENNDNVSDLASITNNNKKSDIAEDKLEKSKDEKPKRLGNHLDYSAHDKDLSNSGYQQKNYNPYTTQINSNNNQKIESPSIDYNKYTNFDDRKYNIKADYTTDYNSSIINLDKLNKLKESKFDPPIPSINSYGLTSFSQPNYTNYASIIKKNPNELPSTREDGGNKIASLNYDLYVGHHYNS